MKKLILFSFVLAFLSCKKSEDGANSDSKYFLTVECTDCNFSTSENPTVFNVKGKKVIPYNYVPNSITLSIWSNVSNDTGSVLFEGGTVKYAVLQLFYGPLLNDGKNSTIVTKNLPPTR